MKNAIIWGASGGIGRAIISKLNDDGWTTIGVARDTTAIASHAKHVFETPFDDPGRLEQVAYLISQEVDNIDFWCYAAGDILNAKVSEMEPRDWHRIISANLTSASYAIHSEEAAWVSAHQFDEGNIGHRPGVKGGYFPVPPVDSLHDIRAAMCTAMEQMGLPVEVHHHEVGTAGQCEIGVKFNTLVKKGDEVQVLKYCVHNVAHAYGKTATFMPKPVVGDNGSGMHVHQSISKDGENTFAGDGYAGLSDTALYYIGGIIKHARALNAFTNASTNSYKRLVPGFEAPVMLAYSARNRSASIRIPYEPSPRGKRVEVRFPDPTANPYLAFAAMLMAGLDGIQNKIHPGDAADKDLYDLPPEEGKAIPTVAPTFDVALSALDADREFLTAGGVFTDDMIDAYIDLKEAEIERLNMTTHPVEFDMYYSV